MRTCGKRTRAGGTCKKPAIPGGTVCRFHGGAAPQVKAKADDRLADLIDPNRALREAAAIAYGNLQDLMDENDVLLPVSKWPRWAAAAVSSMKLTKKNLVAGDNKQEDVVEIKQWDKVTALQMLFRHMGIAGKDTVNIEGDWDKLAQRLASIRQGK